MAGQSFEFGLTRRATLAVLCGGGVSRGSAGVIREAWAAEQRGDYEAARVGYESAMQDREQVGAAHEGLMRVALALHDWAGAAKAYERAKIALGGQGTHWQTLAGRRHFADGDFVVAERHFRSALHQDERYAEALMGLSMVYDTMSRDVEAQQIRQAALNSRPDHRVIRAEWARGLANRNAKLTGLSEALAQMDRSQEEAKRLNAEIEGLRALGDRELWKRNRVSRDSEVKLSRVGSPVFQRYYGVPVVIHGKRLVLKLDSGHEGVRMARRTAKRLGLEQLEPEGGPAIRHLATAMTLGGWAFENVPVDVVERTSDQEGTINPEVFRPLIVTLDWPHYRMRLEERTNEGVPVGLRRIARRAGVLMLPVQLEKREPRLFAVQMGLYSNTIEPGIAPGEPVTDRQAPDYADYRQMLVKFAGVSYGGAEFNRAPHEVLWKQTGVQVVGRLCLEVLRAFRTTIDYRHGAIRFEAAVQ